MGTSDSQAALMQSSYNNAVSMASGAMGGGSTSAMQAGNWGGETYSNGIAYSQNQLGCVQLMPYCNDYYHYHWYPQQVVYTTPTWCSGQIHVWACDHAETCRCGKAKREAPKCAACGK